MFNYKVTFYADSIPMHSSSISAKNAEAARSLAYRDPYMIPSNYVTEIRVARITKGETK